MKIFTRVVFGKNLDGLHLPDPARKTGEGSVSFPVFTRADEGEVISRKAKKMLKLCRGGA